MSKKEMIAERKKNAQKQRGASLVEYALLVSLIAVAAVTIVGTLGGTITTIFTDINTRIANGGGGNP